MRTAFLILVFLHALIHLLGFVKGFGLREVKELTLPISRPMGLLWLVATLLFILYGALCIMQNRYAWAVGLAAVLVSQSVVILFWADARFGTIANVLILLVVTVQWGQFRFHNQVENEIRLLLSSQPPTSEHILEQQHLSGLPEPVRKWLERSGAVGRPHIRTGRVTQRAEMKMKPDQQDWMAATAEQYTTTDPPGFIWTVDAKMNPFLGFSGRDRFAEGAGAMLIKLHSLIPVVKETGEKLDEGTAQRFLGELVWFPSLALSEHVRWEELSDTSAKATFEHAGTVASGTFYFRSNGEFIRYAALRYMGNDPDSKRHEWVLDVKGYRTFEGFRVPAEMTATWKLPEGDWIWLKLRIMDIRYDEPFE